MHILQPLGDISLRGRVVDESGKGVQAQVAAWKDTPDEHELARVKADEDGQFLFRDLRENFVSLRVESEGCSPRLLPGIKPMGQEIDVVVRGRERKESVQYSEVSIQKSEVRSQKSEGRIQNPEVRIQNPESEYRTLNTEHFLPSLGWLRGNPDNGDGIRAEELRGHVVVLHFGSAYVESSLRGLYPREPGVLAQLQKVYGEQGLVVIWVLPEEEGKGEASRLALELYPDMPVGVRREKSGFSVQYSEGKKKNPESRIQNPEDGKKREPGGLLSENGTRNTEHSFPTPESGNLVLGRDGVVRSYCSDQQLFKAVKAATGKSDR
ncbi:MAG: carboxypeptidase-like regulatory domain-containing protein [bacterium]